MEWARLMVRFVRSPVFAVANERAVATWVRLVAFCALQENGGCIQYPASWTDIEWLATTGVTRGAVDDMVAAGLGSRVGTDQLQLAGYSAGAESIATASRLNGSLGGRPPSDPVHRGKQEPLGFSLPEPSGSPRAEKRREEQSRAEQKQEECSEPVSENGSLPPAEVLVSFPTVPGRKGGATEWGLTPDGVALLQEAFPDVDIVIEAKRAKLWVLGQMSRRKTAGGMLEFLRRWITRDVNDGKAAKRRTTTPTAAAKNGTPRACWFHRTTTDKPAPNNDPLCVTCQKYITRLGKPRGEA